MQFNFIWDERVSLAPAAFKTAVISAGQQMASAFDNAITLNIEVGWGQNYKTSWLNSGTALRGGLGEYVAAAGTSNSASYSGTQLVAALARTATSSDDQSSISWLQLAHQADNFTFRVGGAERKLFGDVGPTSTAVDGWIGFSSSVNWDFDPSNGIGPGSNFDQLDFTGAALQGIATVMGRIAGGADLGYTPLDLVSFSQSGRLNITPVGGFIPSSGGGYFSTDGGRTNLGSYTFLADNPAAWALNVARKDAFDEQYFYGSVQPLTTTDVRLLDVLGYHLGTTSTFTGAARNYTIAVSSSSITVQDKVGADGMRVLTGTPKLQFSDQILDTSSFIKTAALAASQIVDLTELYIASFNRAPDALGFDYWGGRLKDGMSLQDIAKSFFVQAETTAAYPAGQTTQDFVGKVYNNVLNRGPDAGGLSYWSGELQNGHVSKDSFLLAIINGARASSGGAADAQILANKEIVGAHFALAQGLSNTTWARTVMANVNGTAASVIAANALTDSFAVTAASANGSELVVKILGIVA